MGDVRTSLPQNAFKQHIGIDLSSASAHTIFCIVAPSTLISHGAFYRDAFRPKFFFYMSIIFHTHTPFHNLLLLITCGDYEAHHCAFLFALPLLSIPHLFSSLSSDTSLSGHCPSLTSLAACSQTSSTKFYVLSTRTATL